MSNPERNASFMRTFFNVLRVVMFIVSSMIFISGLVLVCFACKDFVNVFFHLRGGDTHHGTIEVGIGLLRTIDIFLIAIVFFVFSLGLLVLFSDPAAALPVRLPEWLRIKTFMQLKVILWEAILTTMVIAVLTGLASDRLTAVPQSTMVLIVPAIILLIALSLYFLKKGEGH